MISKRKLNSNEFAHLINFSPLAGKRLQLVPQITDRKSLRFFLSRGIITHQPLNNKQNILILSTALFSIILGNFSNFYGIILHFLINDSALRGVCVYVCLACCLTIPNKLPLCNLLSYTENRKLQITFLLCESSIFSYHEQ